MVGPGYPYWPGAELVVWGPVALPFVEAFPCTGRCTPAADGPSRHNYNTSSGKVFASGRLNCTPLRSELGYPLMAYLSSLRGPTALVQILPTGYQPRSGPSSRCSLGRPWKPLWPPSHRRSRGPPAGLPPHAAQPLPAAFWLPPSRRQYQPPSGGCPGAIWSAMPRQEGRGGVIRRGCCRIHFGLWV